MNSSPLANRRKEDKNLGVVHQLKGVALKTR